jgi:hypothetical protein
MVFKLRQKGRERKYDEPLVFPDVAEKKRTLGRGDFL